MDPIETFESLLAEGKDTPILRFSLGSLYAKQGNLDLAIRHFGAALQQDPEYSAAWKHYAGALAEKGLTPEAARAYEDGIAVAEKKGDMQAAREMGVFLKRLRRAGGSSAPGPTGA